MKGSRECVREILTDSRQRIHLHLRLCVLKTITVKKPPRDGILQGLKTVILGVPSPAGAADSSLHQSAKTCSGAHQWVPGMKRPGCASVGYRASEFYVLCVVHMRSNLQAIIAPLSDNVTQCRSRTYRVHARVGYPRISHSARGLLCICDGTFVY